MKKPSKKVIITVIIVILICIYYYSHYGFPSFGSSAKEKAFSVAVQPVVKKSVTIPIQVIGNVQAYSTVEVKSLVDGQLMQTGFKEGDFVKAGQVLFQIDSRPFEAALEEAQANLAKDEAQLQNAQEQLERNKSLVDKGYVTKESFDQLIANQKIYKAAVAADNANITNAQLEVDYCTIKAPIDGRTGNLQVYPGNIIKTANGTTLVTITQVKPIYIAFSIPQQYLLSVQQMMAKGPLFVTVKIGNKEEQGQLTFINNTVDTSTGTVLLKATFNNNDLLLWPGQYIKVTIPSATLPDALLIPSAAVQMGQDGAYVYMITDNRANYVPIKVGSQVGNETVVTQGLIAGQQVVTDGQLQLTDGAPVKMTSSKK